MLTRLYRAHRQELCGYVMAIFGRGPPEPEDVVQAAFAKFFELDRPEEVSSPRAYLYSAARNFVIDEKRRERRSGAFAKELRYGADQEILSDSLPERVLLGGERCELLFKALKRMPAKRRRLILLNRFEEMSCEEIGRKFGMSSAAVQKQIERALCECLRFMETMDRERKL